MKMEAISLSPEPFSLDESLASIHTDAFGWAMACCRRDRALAEETLQMAYLKVLSGEARFDGRSAFKTWLFGVIRRTAAGERRRDWTSRGHLARLFGLRSGAPRSGNPEEETIARDNRTLLARALARLSDRQRKVLHLVFYQEMSIEEAATVMGLKLGTARAHYERGKKRLRRLLAKVNEE
jgi:RNA polymerase sigma factor (sigma-70 family)